MGLLQATLEPERPVAVAAKGCGPFVAAGQRNLDFGEESLAVCGPLPFKLALGDSGLLGSLAKALAAD